jgi:hypothetical protein
MRQFPAIMSFLLLRGQFRRGMFSRRIGSASIFGNVLVVAVSEEVLVIIFAKAGVMIEQT